MMAKQAMTLLALAIGTPLTWAADDETRELSQSGTFTMNGASLGAAPVLAPAPVMQAPAPFPSRPAAPGPVVAPQVICSSYFLNDPNYCQWTTKYSCPGQPLGSISAARADGTDGYKCCCLQGLWQTTATGGAPVAPSPAVGPPLAPSPGGPPAPGAAGPVHVNHPLFQENIPRSVQLKHKLIQWFESTSQCPLNPNVDGFPAWVGWKAVTAAAPAVTTPPFRIAGNRTMTISGFCPNMQSQDFTCVKEHGELKARATVNKVVKLDLDGLSCNMQDISVYRLDGHLGVRFDFANCKPFEGGMPMPAQPNGIKTASMRAALEPDTVAPGANGAVGFTEFMMAVCTPGSDNKIFFTANLPKFARPLVQSDMLAPPQPNATQGLPTCFSETANTAHVMGKGCFEDFLFFDLQDLNGNIAKIPAQDMEKLSRMVTKNQHSNKPKDVPSPGPIVVGVPAPTPSAVPVLGRRLEECDPSVRRLGSDPCAPQPPKPACCKSYVCQPPWMPRPNLGHILCLDPKGCTILDRAICCIPPPITTTQTTTVFVPEVPGVVIADRVCIFWRDCGPCNNECECTNGNLTGFTFTTTPGPPMTPVCEDFWWENLCIAVLSCVVVCCLCLWFHNRCIAQCWDGHDKKDKNKEIAAGTHNHNHMSHGMRSYMSSFTSAMGGSAQPDHKILAYKEFIPQRSQGGHSMVALNFFSTLIISFVFVHAVYWAWNFVMWFVFGLWRDLVWNAIEIDAMCRFSLFPLCIALWVVNWLCLSYYHCWSFERHIEETVETPTQMEVNQQQEVFATSWYRFGF